MRYWLMKSEPSECDIDDMASYPDKPLEWFGVRNYQARNFMKNDMNVGDLVFFWHSSCEKPGIYGIVEIIHKAHPDSTQFDSNSKYYDAKATISHPIWWCVDVKFVTKTIPFISIQQLRQHEELVNMQVLKKGNRLSITPITPEEWGYIINNLCLIKKK